MVLDSVIFGLLSAFGFGVSDLLAAAVTRKLGILRTVVGVNIVAIALTTVYLVLASSLSEVSPRHWAVLAGLAVLGSITLLAFYRGLQIGPVTIVAPILAAHAVVVILLAMVFVGDRLSGWQVIGVSATITGVVLMSVDLRAIQSGQKLIGVGVLMALVAMVGTGFWQYSVGVLSQDIGWFLPVYVIRLLMLAMIAPASMVRRDWPWQLLTGRLVAGVVLIGVFETGALFAFTRGAEVGVISIVAAASTAYPMVPILGGLLIFRERLALSQVAGLAIALGGLLVLGLAP